MLSSAKVAIGGKGGVGKTTVCAVLARLFANDGYDVLAIDADSDANLCLAFGVDAPDNPEPLIKMKQLIIDRVGGGKDAVGAYFRLNPKVSDLPEKFSVNVDSNGAGALKLLTLGCIEHAGGGCACPEGAFLKALLTHTMLQRQELVLVDLAAGVEFMGRASIRGVDALVVVVEPGSRSIQTAAQIAQMAREMGVRKVAAVLNKVTDAAQVDIVASELAKSGITLLCDIGYSSQIQRADLQKTCVYEADKHVVEALTVAKASLLELISESTAEAQ